MGLFHGSGALGHHSGFDLYSSEMNILTFVNVMLGRHMIPLPGLVGCLSVVSPGNAER